MLAVNMLIKWNNSGKIEILERILWLDSKQDITFVINVYGNNFPIRRRVTEIEGYIADNAVIVLDADPVARIINEDDVTDKDRQKRETSWNVIKEMVEYEPQIFNKKVRRGLIREAALNNNISLKSVEKYLKRYWQRGKVKNALIPDYNICGGRGKDRAAGKMKRGRPRTNTELGIGVNVDENIKQIFRIAINKFYYSSSKISLTLAYELMRKEFFYEDFKVENGVRIPILKPGSMVPTFAQFHYWWMKERDLKKEISSRISLKAYEKDHRAIIGISTTQALGPGSLYQIDATIGDIYLVSRFNRNQIIGKPIITYVTDVFSRLLVGFAISLEGPSWITAMQALASTVAPKKEFCKEFAGIEIEEDDWPAHYLPESLLADRGEIEGKEIETIINSLNIKVQNTPPYRADFKGILERFIKTIAGYTQPLLPGTIDAKAKERGDRDTRLDAKLDLYQFTQVIIKCILFYNNSHYLNAYERDELMIQDEILPVPREIWNWGIKNRSGSLRRVDEDTVKLHLMPRDNALVTARGIKFKNLLYGSPMTLKEHWHEKARNSGSFKVQISYDPRSLNYIYIRGIGQNGYEKCFLLDHQSKYQNKSLEEIQYLQKVEKNQSENNIDTELQSKVQLISEIEHIVKEAEKDLKMETIQGDSNSKRLKDIKKNRKVEKMTLRNEQAFELNKEPLNDGQIIPFSGNEPQEDNENKDIELLKRRQKERLKNDNE